MSLKNIVDCFQHGRKVSRIFYDDNAPVDTTERGVSTYSRTELVSFYAGVLSRPKAVYEIARFFIGDKALGGQGISQEELDDADPLNTKKE